MELLLQAMAFLLQAANDTGASSCAGRVCTGRASVV